MHSTPGTRERAQQIVDLFRAHPRMHDQTSWIYLRDGGSFGSPTILTEDQARELELCKTTMCVAGSAAFLRDGRQIFTRRWQTSNTFNGVGKEELGLSDFEANYLFYDTNNAEALNMVEGLAVGEWRGPDEPVHGSEDEPDW